MGRAHLQNTGHVSEKDNSTMSLRSGAYLSQHLGVTNTFRKQLLNQAAQGSWTKHYVSWASDSSTRTRLDQVISRDLPGEGRIHVASWGLFLRGCLAVPSRKRLLPSTQMRRAFWKLVSNRRQQNENTRHQPVKCDDQLQG